MLVMAISAIESDDDKAFMLNLYTEYYGLVRKNIYNITHDVDQIEDLINDTFIKLIEKTSLIRNMNGLWHLTVQHTHFRVLSFLSSLAQGTPLARPGVPKSL